MTIEHEPVKICAQVGHEVLNVHVHRCRHLEASWGHIIRFTMVTDEDLPVAYEGSYERGPFDDRDAIIRDLVDRFRSELELLLLPE